MIVSENLKNLQPAKSARRRPDKIWDTACLRHASRRESLQHALCIFGTRPPDEDKNSIL